MQAHRSWASIAALALLLVLAAPHAAQADDDWHNAYPDGGCVALQRQMGQIMRCVPNPAYDTTHKQGDRYKLLNNMISVAQHNLQVSGEFLSNYFPVWFANTDRVMAKPNCARQLAIRDRLPPVVQNISNRGVIRIGVTSIVNLPYFNTSNAGATPSGFFFDLGNSLASELGFMLQKSIAAQFVVVPTTNFFNDMVAALNSGIIDTVIGMSYIKTRASRLDYSCWYEGPSPFGLYRNPSAPLPANVTLTGTYQAFNTPAMHIATLPNTIYETALLQYFPLATRVPFSSMDAAYASVGVTTNAVFSIIGETESWNAAHGNPLAVEPGTNIPFGGGNAFATRKV